VTFASAAALTLGRFTVPVYEIYKVGAPPQWADGLDLLSAFGFEVAVIPHYDNAEGGTHDTRYCYLGERRLRLLESDLTDGAFVLGVDEHTAAIIDLDDQTLTVEGNGAVHARRGGSTATFPSGSVVGLGEVQDVGAHPDRPSRRTAPGAPVAVEPPDSSPAAAVGLLASAQELHDEFGAAVDAGDVDAAVASVLATEQALVDWAADPLQSDEPDRARALLREMVVRLGDVARVGAGDPREVIGPFVDAVLAARDAARAARDWDTADALRDRLLAAGVEIHDSPDGTAWELKSG
jgi:hypothetical protein